jgi:hypothetical protein
MKNKLGCLILLVLVESSLFAAPNPGAIKIVNLGNKTINAFTLAGFGFRDVGLDHRPGEMLTPAFGSDDTEYELYWRLEDGSVHGETIVLAEYLPHDADNDPVVIGIHDDHLSLTWAKEDPSWTRYRRVGNPQIYPRPTVPHYAGCDGPLLEHPATKAAWRARMNELRDRNPDVTADESRCVLDWYIVPSDRAWQEPDEQTGSQLHAQWLAQIELYKKQRRQ